MSENTHADYPLDIKSLASCELRNQPPDQMTRWARRAHDRFSPPCTGVNPESSGRSTPGHAYRRNLPAKGSAAIDLPDAGYRVHRISARSSRCLGTRAHGSPRGVPAPGEPWSGAPYHGCPYARVPSPDALLPRAPCQGVPRAGEPEKSRELPGERGLGEMILKLEKSNRK